MLALLDISDQLKQEITSSVNSGTLVIIPEQDITINQWSGIGYMVLDTETFACGYMISGGMAGGAMTWDEVLAAVYLNVREGFKTMLAYMAVLVMFPELWPVFVIIACIGAFSVGWSIDTHIYNCITTGDVREYQEAMVEIASFCFLIAIGEGIQKAYREPETAKQAGDEMSMAGRNNSCFIAGTLVSTKSGMVSIETISVGDIVHSFNAETQEVSEQTVEEIFIHESNQLVYLNVGNETITTTPEHPFYIPQKGFVNAIDLRAGDTLWTVNGEYVIIEKIQHEILESPVKVYNFRVSNNHTYFVGNASVGVHNKAESPNPKYEPTQDLKNHLNTGNGTYSKNNGINGAHNQTEFLNQLNQHGGNVKSSTTVIEGIIEYKYELPRQDGSGIMYNKTYTKTTYDPSIISDQAFVDMAMEAFSSKQPFGNGYIGTDSSGLTWQIYTDSAGNPTTIYPFIPNGD